MSDQLVICGYARTPMGGMMGALADLTGPQMGSVAISAALQRAGLDNSAVDEVLMGCVLSAGVGQSPARQAALGAGLPVGVGTTTVNKMCGSGMKTVKFPELLGFRLTPPRKSSPRRPCWRAGACSKRCSILCRIRFS